MVLPQRTQQLHYLRQKRGAHSVDQRLFALPCPAHDRHQALFHESVRRTSLSIRWNVIQPFLETGLARVHHSVENLDANR